MIKGVPATDYSGLLSLLHTFMRDSIQWGRYHSVATYGLTAPDVHWDCVQVLSVTAKGRLPQASVTLMGSGLMEWSRERDRVINVSAGQYSQCIQCVALCS